MPKPTWGKNDQMVVSQKELKIMSHMRHHQVLHQNSIIQTTTMRGNSSPKKLKFNNSDTVSSIQMDWIFPGCLEKDISIRTLLTSLRLSNEEIKLFEEQEITSTTFISLTKDDLEDIGIDKFGPKIKILKCIEKRRELFKGNNSDGEMSVEIKLNDVQSFLRSLNLDKYVDLFLKNGIDLDIFLFFKTEHLKELGVLNFFDRKKMRFGIEELRKQPEEFWKNLRTAYNYPERPLPASGGSLIDF